jgi:hypothetical protein
VGVTGEVVGEGKGLVLDYVGLVVVAVDVAGVGVVVVVLVG